MTKNVIEEVLFIDTLSQFIHIESLSLTIWGFPGGSWYNIKGAAVDLLCLTRDPEWGMYSDGTDGDKAFVFGAEYEAATSPGNMHTLSEHDIPCVVCLLSNTSFVKMFPGEMKCF